MDLKQLEYFVTVAEAEGFTRAAGKLNIAQSALSRQIKLLEVELDVPLIVRRKRSNELTAAGTRLVEQARGLLRYVQQMREMVIAEATEPRGELAIGFPVALSKLTGAEFVLQMRARYPQVLVRTFVGTSTVMRDMLTNGQVDLAVIGSRREMETNETSVIRPGEIHLIGGKRMFRSFGPTVSLQEIQKLPLIMTIPRAYPVPLLEAAARNDNVPLNIVAETQHIELFVELVRRKLGYAIIALDFVTDEVKKGLIESRLIKDISFEWLVARPKAKAVSPAMRVAEELVRELMVRP